MLKDTFAKACQAWEDAYQKWLDGEHDEVIREYGEEDYPKGNPRASFIAWHGEKPDDPERYQNWEDHEATWYQVWETVSEGTPVTPPFATKEELVDYLVEHGDFWDQQRRKEGIKYMNSDPWDRETASRFVFGRGWMPSLAIVEKDGKQVFDNRYTGDTDGKE